LCVMICVETYKFKLSSSTQSQNQQNYDPVISGAMQLVVALLYAFPQNASDYNAQRIWHKSATTLHAALIELEIWDDILIRTQNNPSLINLKQWIEDAVKRSWLEAFIRKPIKDSCELLYLFFVYHCQANINISLEFKHLFYRWLHYYDFPNPPYPPFFWTQNPCCVAMQERFAPMFSWPLPSHINKHQRSNVGQLLLHFASAPKNNATKATLEVVQFAAALLGSRVVPRKESNWRLQAANCWLSQSLPRWVFSDDIEQILSNTP